MPTYEYKCDECGAEFEVTQGMDDEPLSQCRECSGSVRRMISFTSFSLKGGGWYSDGYAGESPSKKNGDKPKNKVNGKKQESPKPSGSTTTPGKDK
jgi:putative FmdB family regulatory protein